MSRYAAGPDPSSSIASSASVTNGAPASGDVYAAMVPMPICDAVRRTRRAISPRFAMNSFVTALILDITAKVKHIAPTDLACFTAAHDRFAQSVSRAQMQPDVTG